MASPKLPSLERPCYDCGSTLVGRHTKLCDLAGPRDRLDLPAKNHGVQHWDGTDAIDSRTHEQAVADCRAYQAAHD